MLDDDSDNGGSRPLPPPIPFPSLPTPETTSHPCPTNNPSTGAFDLSSPSVLQNGLNKDEMQEDRQQEEEDGFQAAVMRFHMALIEVTSGQEREACGRMMKELAAMRAETWIEEDSDPLKVGPIKRAAALVVAAVVVAVLWW